MGSFFGVAVVIGVLIFIYISSRAERPKEVSPRRDAVATTYRIGKEPYADIDEGGRIRDLTASEVDAILKLFRDRATEMSRIAKRADKVMEKVYAAKRSVSAALEEIQPWAEDAKRLKREFTALEDRISFATDGGNRKISDLSDRIDDAYVVITNAESELKNADIERDGLIR